MKHKRCKKIGYVEIPQFWTHGEIARVTPSLPQWGVAAQGGKPLTPLLSDTGPLFKFSNEHDFSRAKKLCD